MTKWSVKNVVYLCSQNGFGLFLCSKLSAFKFLDEQAEFFINMILERNRILRGGLHPTLIYSKVILCINIVSNFSVAL